LAETQRVSKLVGYYGLKVVAGIDLPVDAGAEQDVAGGGAAIAWWGQERLGEHTRRKWDHADADIAESRVILLIAGCCHRRPAVRDQCQVGIGRTFPERRCDQDLLHPGRRRKLGVESL